MSQKKRIKLTVRIDSNLYEALKRLVIAKFGTRYWGGLRIIVEEALKHYIASHNIKINSPNYDHINTHNPPPKVHHVYWQVKKFLRERYGDIIESTRSHILAAIGYIRGEDPRTKRKWFNIFLKYRCIKHIAGERYELI